MVRLLPLDRLREDGRAPLAPGWLGRSSKGCLSTGPDSILRLSRWREPHRHLVSEGSPRRRSFPADCHNLQRCYRTLGRYPGHRCVSADGLVVGALRAFPHFDGVAARSLRRRPTPELTKAPRRRLAPPYGGTKANHAQYDVCVTFLTPLAGNPPDQKDR